MPYDRQLRCAFALIALFGCEQTLSEPRPPTNAKVADEPDAAVPVPEVRVHAGGEAPDREPPAAESVAPSDVLRSDVDRDDDAGIDPRNELPFDLPHPEGNDLTHPCQTNAACNYGACYVPGRDINPICSKRCDADVDCPDGARCARPLECQSDEPCTGSGYCFRACETDAECTAFNPLGTHAGADPLTTNPVQCVSWVPIAAFGDTTPPPAPIDICIQRSEP